MIKNSQTPFWIFSLAIVFVLTLPFLIQDGMFMDAMLYTSVSHNLSMGLGTFWFPWFSTHNIAGLSTFHEHPPLVFGIQSMFFKILGDSMYVERFYVFCTLIITILLINILWKEIFEEDNGLRRMAWLPVLLWILNPTCFFSYRNNMQENTMGIFTLIAVLFILKALKRNSAVSLPGIIAGVFIFFASFSKGLPGFFPLCTPVIYFFIMRNGSIRKAAIITFIVTIIPIIIYGIILLFPYSRESLTIYFIKRVLHRINENPTVSNRFEIIIHLIKNLSISIFITFFILIIAYVKKIKLNLSSNIRIAVFILMVGLSASAPLILTKVQRGFYLVPSFPFFGIGLAILIAPLFKNFFERMNPKSVLYRTLLLSSTLVFAGVLTYTGMLKGKALIEPDTLHDIYIVGKIIPRYSNIEIGKGMWDDWYLQVYLIRYFNISLDPHHHNNYYLKDKSLHESPDEFFKKIELPTVKYDLYKRID